MSWEGLVPGAEPTCSSVAAGRASEYGRSRQGSIEGVLAAEETEECEESTQQKQPWTRQSRREQKVLGVNPMELPRECKCIYLDLKSIVNIYNLQIYFPRECSKAAAATTQC